MKKGFTLVELLAVIVILAVILVIAVPQINSVITQTKKNSLGSTAKLIAAKAKEKEVENDILGISETMTCASLVTLDENYGNCTVTKSNGYWTVTIAGAGRFAGLSCTGTNSNMNCVEGVSNTPEYVYTYENIPYYRYEYTVTDVDLCRSDRDWEYLNSLGSYQYSLHGAEYVEAACTGQDLSDYWSDILDPLWSLENFDNYSAFLSRSSIGSIADAEADYANLIDSNYNEAPEVFIRYSGSLTEFEGAPAEICTLYGGNLTCFDPSDGYSVNASAIETLFGVENCEEYEGDVSCSGGNESYWYCTVREDDGVRCASTNSYCHIYPEYEWTCGDREG